MIHFDRLHEIVESSSPYRYSGKVDQVVGLTVRVKSLYAFVGEICKILLPAGGEITAEVVGFQGDCVILMPLGDLDGIMTGCPVVPTGKALSVKVSSEMLGQILDGLGNPLSETAPEGRFDHEVQLYRSPPNPLTRPPIKEIMHTGVRAIDAFLTCGQGQRLGVFAGSGVGKSTLLGMISRYSDADINVIALIGERGREVKAFLDKDLGPEGLKKSVVICATSDQPPLVRLKGAFLATAVAEYFRDQGKKVMLMMDSVTRFAMAQREVSLAAGEAPATKGYTPSVFALLPKLLERSGTAPLGSITAFYTVLVEGDDMNEPIADAVRGILDGHIVLSRELAAQSHYPAIDIPQSVSRLFNDLLEKHQVRQISSLRQLMGAYRESEDLIQIGAYKTGSSPIVDRAIALKPSLDEFLRQEIDEISSYNETRSRIEALCQTH
ncbi:FliI/YscN family ATPase [Acidaminobacter hydrogenoformans]|uniref:Type III secretion system ATPase, FliI/YscN n=1 Tax=Acidaminobacter hydrogenoformans DSM 2784 TaxID=1120920 RepID=A0A1G5RVB7_9FIRM|nr:FliI/YscN family ATPase [Acidaminobacter hydrogenoformans]SCZ77798.1 type III secretion system ATPase, FliI/YscN [Acidaminobacter hydrogenoformans DSM 2784]